MRLLRAVLRFLESKPALVFAVAALTIVAGQWLYRSIDRGPPSRMLEYRVTPEWHGDNLWLRLQYRIRKTRDCNYTSDRFIEYKIGGDLRSFRIDGARGSGVRVGDTSWHETTFREVRDVLEPGMHATLIVRGYYQCPEGDNPVADAVIAPFTVPAKQGSPASPLTR